MPPKKNARAQGKVSVKESNPKEAEKDKVEKHNDGTPAVARAVDGMAADAAPKLLSQKHRHKAGSPSPERNAVTGATGAVPQPPPPANSAPKKDRLGHCDLVQKELIDKLDDPFFKAKNVKDIPESVQSLYTDAVLDTLLGVTRCAACGCTIVEHRETVDTALEILRKAEEGGRATELDWVFSYPQLPPAQNLAAIRASFDKADKAIERTIQGELTTNADSRGDLLFAVQAGMGIGKSFSIDMASQLLFVDQNPLVLKVTYNRDQRFSETEMNKKNDGVLARLAIAVKKIVPPFDDNLVGRMLSCQEPLTTETLADYIDEHRQGRPVILAVDEIGHIAREPIDVSRMLSTIIQVFLQLLRKHVPCRGIVTALPSVETKTFSGRGLRFVRPPILTPEHSMSLLKSVLAAAGDCSEEYGEAELSQVLSLCNGHPRSLVMAGKLMSGKNKVAVTANMVANECNWKEDQGPTAHQIVNFLSEQYLGESQRTETGTPKSEVAVALYMKNLLFTSRDGCDVVIPPIILFIPTEGLKDGLRFAKQMFNNNPTQGAPKNLEDVHMNWDYFRCQYRLPVVPPTMSVLGTPIEEKVCFMFKPYNDPETRDVVVTSSMRKRVAIANICEKTYYKPSNTSHFAFESMCVGRIDGNNERILILFQSKINSDFKTAYTNLQSAAALLRKGRKPAWKGRILFVILACGTSSSSVTVNEEHSVLLIGKDELSKYFTRSLVPAVELLVEGHQSTKKSARK